MGITQWILRDSSVLQGEYLFSIPKSIQLVIISEEVIDLNNLLVRDILQAMIIDSLQVCCISSKKAFLLPKEIICPCWILGYPLSINSKKWIINTVSLRELFFNPELKRTLWMQICQHVYKI